MNRETDRGGAVTPDLVGILMLLSIMGAIWWTAWA